MKKAYLLAISVILMTVAPAFGADVEKGRSTYAQRCAMCHGDKGGGDGPLAATMPEGLKPRNLTAGGNKYATDDAKLAEILEKGGAAVGLSPLMPPQPDLKGNDLADLIAFVKSLKK